MITVFNRKELLVTFDMQRQANVRDILSANGIKYALKVTNRQGASLLGSNRSRTGSFGTSKSLASEYKFYVHKNEYDSALKLIK